MSLYKLICGFPVLEPKMPKAFVSWWRLVSFHVIAPTTWSWTMVCNVLECVRTLHAKDFYCRNL